MNNLFNENNLKELLYKINYLEEENKNLINELSIYDCCSISLLRENEDIIKENNELKRMLNFTITKV